MARDDARGADDVNAGSGVVDAVPGAAADDVTEERPLPDPATASARGVAEPATIPPPPSPDGAEDDGAPTIPPPAGAPDALEEPPTVVSGGALDSDDEHALTREAEIDADTEEVSVPGATVPAVPRPRATPTDETATRQRPSRAAVDFAEGPTVVQRADDERTELVAGDPEHGDAEEPGTIQLQVPERDAEPTGRTSTPGPAFASSLPPELERVRAWLEAQSKLVIAGWPLPWILGTALAVVVTVILAAALGVWLAT